MKAPDSCRKLGWQIQTRKYLNSKLARFCGSVTTNALRSAEWFCKQLLGFVAIFVAVTLVGFLDVCLLAINFVLHNSKMRLLRTTARNNPKANANKLQPLTNTLQSQRAIRNQRKQCARELCQRGSKDCCIDMIRRRMFALSSLRFVRLSIVFAECCFAFYKIILL